MIARKVGRLGAGIITGRLVEMTGETAAERRMDSFKLTWTLLDAVGRRAAIRMVLLSVAAALAEAAGIGLVVPAIALIADPSIIQRLSVIDAVAPGIQAMSPRSLSVVVASAVAAGFMLRTGILAFVSWRQAAFVGAFQANLSDRLFRQYLLQPWPFHLSRNSAVLMRNATSESMEVVLAVGSQIVLVSEGLLLSGFLALLLAFEPIVGTIVIFMLGAIALSFQRLVKDRVREWGEQRQIEFGNRNQQFMQGLGGAKELILLGRWQYFANRFRVHTGQIARLGTKVSFISQLPRLLLELVAIVALTGMAVAFTFEGRSPERIILALGIFAAVAARSLPSVNRMLSAAQQLHYARSALTTLSGELASPAESPPLIAPPTTVAFNSLQLADVCFCFPGSQVEALSGVNLCIRAGQCVGVMGTSGAGKSTLVDVMLGLLTPTSGSVLVNGGPIGSQPVGWQRQIGYIPQTIYLSDDTLRRNVAFGVDDASIDDEAVERAIKAAQLDEFVRSLPEGLDTKVGERGARLSGGQRQRIGIARALYHDPPVLVMDEATSALDNVTEHEVMQAVNGLRGSKTMVIVAHRLSTLQECDLVIELVGGRVVRSGSFAQMTGVHREPAKDASA